MSPSEEVNARQLALTSHSVLEDLPGIYGVFPQIRGQLQGRAPVLSAELPACSAQSRGPPVLSNPLTEGLTIVGNPERLPERQEADLASFPLKGRTCEEVDGDPCRDTCERRSKQCMELPTQCNQGLKGLSVLQQWMDLSSLFQTSHRLETLRLKFH